MAFALLVILYVLVCIFLIIVVLFQQGKGADLAGAFGGGGSSTNFGPRSRTNYLHWVTTASFVLFVVLSMSLAIIQGNRGGSVLENAAPTEEASEAPAPAELAPGGDTSGDETSQGEAAPQPEVIEETGTEAADPAGTGDQPSADAASESEATNDSEPAANDAASNP